LRFASSDTKREASRSSRRLGSGMQSSPIFSTRLGMIDTRFALPHRSPKPLNVPCTWPTPSATAASEFATAHSASLCTWMPIGARTRALTALIISTSSTGSVPPLVSHRTSQLAPAASAAFRVASA